MAINLYISGSGVRRRELDPRIPPGHRHILLSCHGKYVNIAHKFSKDLTECGQPFSLMYDSGAFTAWSKGAEITLEELIPAYDAMLERYASHAKEVWLISLDKIPGSKGRTATPAEIDEAVMVSDENYRKLVERYGSRVLPVFHQNESEERLREVCEMADYICVSPRNDLHEDARRRWSSEVHQLIKKWYPNGKATHGLAATGYHMMTKVPWHSVDSASPLMLAMFGKILIGKMQTVNISSESGALKDRDRHFRTMPDVVKQALTSDIESLGFTVDELENDFPSRFVWNRTIMLNLLKEEKHLVTAAVQQTLFDL